MNYSPRPWHTLYPTFLMLIGTIVLSISTDQDWDHFGVALYALAVLIVVWMFLASLVDARISHTYAQTSYARELKQVKDDALRALGVKPVDEVKVTYTSMVDGQWEQSIYSLGVSLEKLQTMARGVLNGIPFSELKWCPKVLSSHEFRNLQDEFEIRKYLVINPNKTSRFTPTGLAFLRMLANKSESPSFNFSTEGENK